MSSFRGTHDRRAVTRRELLAAAGLSGAALAFFTSARAQTPATPVSFAEAPTLTERVNSGELPAVEERLPTQPLVVEPVERVGVYGGTWRMALVGGSDTQQLNRTVGYEPLVRWDLEWKNIVPNLATDIQVSDDSRVYTVTLRDGVKWSDGEPFTTEDILFYVNDVRLNTELGGGPGINPVSAEATDAKTITISFEKPNGLFLSDLAGPSGDVWTSYPSHYLKQFHATYNTTNLDELIAEAGASGWVELFGIKGHNVAGTSYNARWGNVELPTIYAWQLTEPYGDGTRVSAVRNPYYWKVDTAGNQLPYIETLNYAVLQDTEVLLLQAANGEIDMQHRNLATTVNKPVLADAQEAGGFHFYDTISSYANTASIHLNLTHKDPVKREIFANKDFRIGLSHAINRQEIIDIIFAGQTEAWQNAPHRDTRFFNEQLAKQYTEFDLALAEESLNKVLPNKDGDDFRVGPDGNRLSFTIEFIIGETVDITNLVVDQWRAIGIDVTGSLIDRSLFEERHVANDHDATVFFAAGGIDVIENPPQFVPVATRADYAQAWVNWYLNPTSPNTTPEEPPEVVREQMALYDQVKQTSDPDEQAALMLEVLQIAADQFYSIGVCLPPRGYGVVKNNFFNVPAVIFDSFTWLSPAPANPSQFFIEGEA
jgi:peptide/nickel transport system substrate-binding protein